MYSAREYFWSSYRTLLVSRRPNENGGVAEQAIGDIKAYAASKL